MRTIKFHSWLSEPISRLIGLRRFGGTDYSSQARLLSYFDGFLVEQYPEEKIITRHLIDHYLQTISHLCPRGQYNRFCVVRQLCRYIALTESRCYVPESIRHITSTKMFRPYIFSNQEIKALLAAAAGLSPQESLRPHTYQTLLGLLYTTGIRIGEAFALTLKDFQDEVGLLYIAEGKFRKARWIPLHPSSSRMLKLYVDHRLQNSPNTQDSSLFINLPGRSLRHCTVYQAFRQLLEKCSIEYNKHTGPRIHDMRHTFAVHRLLAWYKDKQDVNAMLPALATYMGHVSISSTQVYLHPTADLLEQVNNRFHNHFLRTVKVKGGKL
ncbi:MAG: tyrosine-type recombinase/integrase [Desulfobacterales bacterium]